jgi:hypothetical protein
MTRARERAEAGRTGAHRPPSYYLREGTAAGGRNGGTSTQIGVSRTGTAGERAGPA